jgi:hypothetical protein
LPNSLLHKKAAEIFFETKTHNQHQAYTTPKEDANKMGEKVDKHHIEELKEMIQEKEPKEPVEKVLVKFCERHGVSIDTCRIYYNRLVEKGEVKEK